MTTTAIKPTYVIGIPKWGRSAYGVLRLLASKGYIPQTTANYWIEVLDADRKRIDIESHGLVNGTRSQFSQVREVANFLNVYRDEEESDPERPGKGRLTERAKAIADHLTTDKNDNRRGRPDRIKINDFAYETEDYVIIFHGISHEGAVSAFQGEEIHGAMVGFDEYQALGLANGNGNNPLRRWEAIDRKPGPHDVVALGAAGLKDPTWHAFGHPANKTYSIRNGHPYLSGENIVFIDPMYGPTYGREMPQLQGKTTNYREADLLPTRKSEHMSILYGNPVVAIVNTGGSIKGINDLSAGKLLEQLEEGAEWYERNGLPIPRMPDWITPSSSGPWLRISGNELGFSETLLMTAKKYMGNQALMEILEGFEPIPYRSPAREAYITTAYASVMKNVGDVWTEPPPLEAFLPEKASQVSLWA